MTAGGDWIEFGTPVTNTAVAGAPVGVFALGIFQDAPIFASFESFDITGDETQPGSPEVQAFADPPAGAAPLNVRFSANGTDPEGGRLTYTWDFGDGATAPGRVANHTYTAAGSYTAKVTATDRDGLTATSEVDVEVSGDAAPTVEASADRTSGPAPLRVRLSADASDPNGGPLTYEWDFGDGASAFGRNAPHTYAAPGTYVAEVTVTDATGLSATDTVTITVTNAAPTVQAAANPRTGGGPLRVTLSAAGTDPEGQALSYRWEFGDGTAPAAGRTATHTYVAAGTYTARVTATDPHGASGSGTVTITVANSAPTVRAAADPASGAAPLRVRLSAAGSDPDGGPLLYSWDFGDGQRAAGASAVHTYSRAGTYTATVTVRDAGGRTGTATVTVTVNAARQGSGGVQGEDADALVRARAAGRQARAGDAGGAARRPPGALAAPEGRQAHADAEGAARERGPQAHAHGHAAAVAQARARAGAARPRAADRPRHPRRDRRRADDPEPRADAAPVGSLTLAAGGWRRATRPP